MNRLRSINITNIKGVGQKKAQLFNNLKIFSIYDLLTYYPKKYEDFSKFSKIKDSINESGLFHLKVISHPIIKRARNGMTILTIGVSDGDDKAEIVYFNQPYMEIYYKKGANIYYYGNVKKRGFIFQITNGKLLKKTEIGSLNPIYGLTDGLSNNEIKKFITSGFYMFENDISEMLPNQILKKYGLMNIKKAIKFIHFPTSKSELMNARYRLAFNELLILQNILEKNKYKDISKASPLMYNNCESEIKHFIKNLDFSLTKAQERTYKEILNDINSKTGMNRLLQGDVGTGKTIIAALAIYYVALNGYQSALMTPTEILAKQHYDSIKEYFSESNINIALITGNMDSYDKSKILCNLKNGEIDLIIGTHALIQPNVTFNNLALTVIDEQHRFGVNQRRDLYNKGNNPNILAMTATPIPRTLALIAYGDMDISILDELPKGRQKVDTFVIDYNYLDRLDSFIISQVNEGRQVFIVCPTIEEGYLPLMSVEEVFNRYSANKFTDLKIKTAYLHGKLKNDEKSSIMLDFLENKFQILVSTTVIEVGINIPNASLMIVYDADRFGLSQLHQLRGRVGRGKHKSYCVLINNNKSEESYRRMKVMQQSNDGFEIAETDLSLRGQGELMGTRQHGLPDLNFVDLQNDFKLIRLVKINYDTIVKEIQKDPNCEVEFNNYIKFNLKSLELLEN